MADLLILDAESYYDDDFSLRKMTTPAYILDPRFELQMVACKLNNGPHEIIDGPDFPAYLAKLDAKKTITVSHNALFDASVFAWRYVFVPGMMLDTMALARALLGHELNSLSLENVAAHLQLGSKGKALRKTKGLRREQIISMGLWDEFCAYARQDNILCEGILWRLLPQLPECERRTMDLVIRCCVEPQFVCDLDMLRGHLEVVQAAKAELLNNCSIDQIKLMSGPKFKSALEQLGVVVAMKESPTAKNPDGTPKLTPAFAKTDAFMEELAEHDDPRVQAMAAARLGLKSTLEESRTKRMIEIVDAFNANGGGGNLPNMPMPLRYSGAHTHRLSGDWKINCQNFPADRKKDGKSKLRASLKAPQGYKVIVCDLGQIEARLVAWICGADNLLTQFRDNLDPYSRLGSVIFGRPINRKLPSDFAEGFIGKTGILGLGYRMGKAKFHKKVLEGARTFEVDISQIYSEEVGHKAVDAYRTTYPAIPAAWRQLDNLLLQSWYRGNNMQFGPNGTVKISKGCVLGPTGMKLLYADSQMITAPDKFNPGSTRQELAYRNGRKLTSIHGGSFLENIVQHLARCQVMAAGNRIHKKGYNFALQGHDELVYIVRQECVDEVSAIVHSSMIRPPAWAPDLPLTADVGVGDSYAAAK